ncbi:MAG TPA: solute carrier family 23 protein, partial [Clostridia bacterium]|nr:solute carrier family 23 protein [Clostridia bacterium]
EKRTRNGIGITGLGNIFAGLFGVVGVVNFSMSPGIIAATGCASRYTLIPAGIGLGLLAFSPIIVASISTIPELVIGSILLYLMSTQIAAGLGLLAENKAIKEFNDGIVVGMPIMLAVIIAFLPADLLATIPPIIRPIAGNGFVMGVILVIVVEHLVNRA